MGEMRDVTWTKEPPTVEGWYWCRRTDTGLAFVINLEADAAGLLRDADDPDPYPLAEAFWLHEWWPLPLHPPAETEQKP